MSEIKKRGLASMTPERRRMIARLGGKASQATGTAHKFTSLEARRAGKTAQANGKAHRWTTEEMTKAWATGKKTYKRPKTR
jgi:hypothetical protein